MTIKFEYTNEVHKVTVFVGGEFVKFAGDEFDKLALKSFLNRKDNGARKELSFALNFVARSSFNGLDVVVSIPDPRAAGGRTKFRNYTIIEKLRSWAAECFAAMQAESDLLMAGTVHLDAVKSGCDLPPAGRDDVARSGDVIDYSDYVVSTKFFFLPSFSRSRMGEPERKFEGQFALLINEKYIYLVTDDEIFRVGAYSRLQDIAEKTGLTVESNNKSTVKSAKRALLSFLRREQLIGDIPTKRSVMVDSDAERKAIDWIIEFDGAYADHVAEADADAQIDAGIERGEFSDRDDAIFYNSLGKKSIRGNCYGQSIGRIMPVVKWNQKNPENITTLSAVDQLKADGVDGEKSLSNYISFCGQNFGVSEPKLLAKIGNAYRSLPLPVVASPVMEVVENIVTIDQLRGNVLLSRGKSLINCVHVKETRGNSSAIYCGRKFGQFEDSVFGNPFYASKDKTRLFVDGQLDFKRIADSTGIAPSWAGAKLSNILQRVQAARNIEAGVASGFFMEYLRLGYQVEGSQIHNELMRLGALVADGSAITLSCWCESGCDTCHTQQIKRAIQGVANDLIAKRHAAQSLPVQAADLDSVLMMPI